MNYPVKGTLTEAVLLDDAGSVIFHPYLPSSDRAVAARATILADYARCIFHGISINTKIVYEKTEYILSFVLQLLLVNELKIFLTVLQS